MERDRNSYIIVYTSDVYLVHCVYTFYMIEYLQDIAKRGGNNRLEQQVLAFHFQGTNQQKPKHTSCIGYVYIFALKS